jgi:hypothetical protein
LENDRLNAAAPLPLEFPRGVQWQALGKSGGATMESQYLEIAKFDAWAEADIFRGRLAAQGIAAVLIGPNTSSTLGMYMGVASKVSVMVPKNSAARAQKILAEDETARTAEPEKAYRSSAPATPTRVSPPRAKKKSVKK